MRALIQRVSRAAVRVEGDEIARIETGFLILLGVADEDTPLGADRLAERCATLRIFEDEGGKMNRSLRDVSGEAIVVSQFTLYADTTRGRRPGFEGAARPEVAIPLYERFCDRLEAEGVPTRRGRFGASMDVELVNQGPATFLLEG